jgi:hypothetical protein
LRFVFYEYDIYFEIIMTRYEQLQGS